MQMHKKSASPPKREHAEMSAAPLAQTSKSFTLPASMRYNSAGNFQGQQSEVMLKNANKELVSSDSNLAHGHALGRKAASSSWCDQDDGDGSESCDDNLSATRSGDSGGFNANEHGSASAPVQERLDEKIHDLNQKIEHIKGRIKTEQMSRDDSVDEYLKLTADMNTPSENPQLMRIRQVFEKKNKRNAQTIQHLQKKLETYVRRLEELESGDSPASKAQSAAGVSVAVSQQPRKVLKDVGQNLKDLGTNVKESITVYTGGFVDNLKGGLSGISTVSQNAAETVMSVPKDLAHKLLKTKYGSADNIHQSIANDNEVELVPVSNQLEKDFHQLDSLRRSSGAGNSSTGSMPTSSRDLTGKMRLQRSTAVLGLSTESEHFVADGLSAGLDVQPLLDEIKLLKENQHSLQESVDAVKQQVQEEYRFFSQIIHELKYRQQRLEDQINDITELHQCEVANLKTELASLEEKIEYREEERLRDLTDLLENCQTRVAKVEHTQLSQLSGATGLEGFQPATNTLGIKGIQLLVILLQFILIVVSTVSQVAVPFLRTRGRAIVSVLLVLLLCAAYRSRNELSSFIDSFLGINKPLQETSS